MKAREQKNFPLLIRAFGKLTKEIPARLVIVGGGREKARLEALIRELGLEESVALLGYQNNPFAYMRKADLFVTTSLWEGMPNTLVEALACGLPAIATDCSSGPREILAPDTDYQKRLSEGSEHTQYGVLTAVGDEAALIKEMRAMLQNKLLRTKYQMASIECAEKFDTTKVLPCYEEILTRNK